jgi:hypothetical protein
VLDLVQPLLGGLAGHRLDDERQRDRAGADPGSQPDRVVAEQDAELGAVVVAEQARLGERRAVGAGVVQRAVRQPPVEVQVARLDAHADERVTRVDRPGLAALPREAVERLDQPRRRRLVERGHPVDGLVSALVHRDLAHADRGEGVLQRTGHDSCAPCGTRVYHTGACQAEGGALADAPVTVLCNHTIAFR